MKNDKKCKICGKIDNQSPYIYVCRECGSDIQGDLLAEN